MFSVSRPTHLYIVIHLSIKMGVERLQLFVRFCNISGLFPFRMVLNEVTGKFKRFDCHWRHFANLWFIFVLLAQLAFTVLVIYISMPFFSNSPLYTFSALMDACSFCILNWTPRLLFFHFKKLEMVFDCLNHFDKVLANSNCRVPCCTIRRRTIIGIIISSVLVTNDSMVFCFKNSNFCFFISDRFPVCFYDSIGD